MVKTGRPGRLTPPPQGESDERLDGHDVNRGPNQIKGSSGMLVAGCAAALAATLVGAVLAGLYPAPTIAEPLPESPERKLVFIVEGSCNNRIPPGVSVVLISPHHAARPVGVTDSGLRVAISKVLLAENRDGVLVFCQKNFFCGAVRLDEPDLLGYDELLVQLAPMAFH